VAKKLTVARMAAKSSECVKPRCPKVRVANAEVEAIHRNPGDGAESAHGPDALGSLLAIEAGETPRVATAWEKTEAMTTLLERVARFPALEKSAVPVGEGAVVARCWAARWPRWTERATPWPLKPARMVTEAGGDGGGRRLGGFGRRMGPPQRWVMRDIY